MHSCSSLTGAFFRDGAAEAELLKIYRPRPGLPFTKMRLDDGTERLLWTTFTSEQVDIDVRSPQGKRYLDQILNQFQTCRHSFHPAGRRRLRHQEARHELLHDSRDF